MADTPEENPGSIEEHELRSVVPATSDVARSTASDAALDAASEKLQRTDRWRFRIGVAVMLVAAALVIAPLFVVLCAIEDIAKIPKPGMVFLAKSIALASCVGIAGVALRLAERLTTPLVELIRIEEARALKGAGATSPDNLLELLTRLLELTKLGKQ